MSIAKKMRYAAKNGNLELKYENGCPWNEEATEQAAENGHLKCLKYLHENGCPWDEVQIESKVKVWWKMVQDIIRTKYIIFYWLEKTAINSYSENGQGRKRDRQQFETDFDTLTQPSEKRKMSDATKEKPKFKLGVTNNHKKQSKRYKQISKETTHLLYSYPSNL